MIWEAGMCRRRQEGKRKGFLSSVFFFSYLYFIFPGFIKPHLTHVWLGWRLSPQRVGSPFSPLHATPSRSPFLFSSIYISKQATSRSNTVTNDEAFHQWLAWYAEIVYGEVSLIISRWVCCLALVCVLPASCHCFILSLSLGARCRLRGMCQWVSQKNVFEEALHASELITRILRPAIALNPNELSNMVSSYFWLLSITWFIRNMFS